MRQKGFAGLEALLILVLIGIIGGIGWYALHTKNQTDKILSQADKISQATPQKTTASSTKQSYLTIKEWNVRAPYNGKLTLQYHITSDNLGEVWAQFSSKELSDSDSSCNATNQPGGIIVRLAKGEHLRGPTGQDTGQTVEQAISSGVISKYSHVGDNYYYFEASHANCAQNETQKIQDLQSQTSSAVQDVANHLTAITAQ